MAEGQLDPTQWGTLGFNPSLMPQIPLSWLELEQVGCWCRWREDCDCQPPALSAWSPWLPNPGTLGCPRAGCCRDHREGGSSLPIPTLGACKA